MSSPICEANLTAETNDTPRKKCCAECLFRQGDPQGLQADEDWSRWVFDWEMGLLVFYCVHTTDEQGRNQICAGYWALFGRHLEKAA